MKISSVEELENALSEPYPEDLEWARGLEGDVAVLGAGGKMGPTLVRRIARSLRGAGATRQVYAVSRYSDPQIPRRLEAEGAVPIAADLLRADDLPRLTDCRYLIYLVGSKFGTEHDQGRTWAVNAYLPGRMMRQYPDARITVLSTGNVYPLVDIESGGCTEAHPPAPVGEYAQSCLGRERVVDYFSRRNSMPVCVLRLNYAVEARYGVLLDIARCIWDRRPVPLSMGYVNVIWQGDANSVSFRSLALAESPPRVLNLTGPEVLSVREISRQFGLQLGRNPEFEGREPRTALLSNAEQCHELLGAPKVPASAVIDLVADWVRNGRPTLGKPTHFETRDGRF